jgi:hypothetical protein
VQGCVCARGRICLRNSRRSLNHASWMRRVQSGTRAETLYSLPHTGLEQQQTRGEQRGTEKDHLHPSCVVVRARGWSWREHVVIPSTLAQKRR